MHCKNLRRVLKANIAESYIIKAPPPPTVELKRYVTDGGVSLLSHAPVTWNAAQSLACKFLLLYKFLKSLFSRDKIFLVVDTLFAAKLTKPGVLP